jgi:uncharacterized protein (TIGR02118 family)
MVPQEETMHCVRIFYPNEPGSSFNWRHYYDVHLPLGLGLLARHTGVKPVRVEVDRDISADGKGSAGRYHCICSVYFADRAGAEAMLGLFSIEEARRQLAEDWPKYTATDPEILVTEIVDADPLSGRTAAA